jgi:hypothetical protein
VRHWLFTSHSASTLIAFFSEQIEAVLRVAKSCGISERGESFLDGNPKDPFNVERQRSTWWCGVADIDFFPNFVIYIEEFQLCCPP